MAKINIAYDTESKKCDILLDGRVIEDVQYISIEKYKDKAHLRIDMRSDEMDGMVKFTSVVAAKDHPDTVGVKSNDGQYIFIE